MIIRGVVITSSGVIDDHIVAPSAVDCSSRPPLFLEHRRPVGQVLRLQVVGDRLLVVAETSDPDALARGYLSPAGKPLERRRRPDGLWDVSCFRLQEISCVYVPQNPDARITERCATDPLHEFIKARNAHMDLFAKAFTTLQRGLSEAFR